MKEKKKKEEKRGRERGREKIGARNPVIVDRKKEIRKKA